MTEHSVHQYILSRGPISSEQLVELALQEQVVSEQAVRNAIASHIAGLLRQGKIFLNLEQTGFVATTDKAIERTRVFMQRAVQRVGVLR